MSFINKILIEKESLIHNINVIKEKAQGAKIIAVLKGNCNGLGTNILPKILIENGIDTFAVCDIYEAKELRQMGYSNDILLMNSTSIESEIDEIISNGFILSLGSFEAINKTIAIAKKLNNKIRAHLALDTGFSRFGFDAKEMIYNKAYFEKVCSSLDSDVINLEGVFSHFQQSYENDRKRTYEQFDLFNQVTSLLKEHGFSNLLCHISNSSALFKYPEMKLDAVRVGSAFTGRLQIKEQTGLKRVGKFSSCICEIRTLKKGSKIGYSGTLTLKKDMKVGIVEAGYSDGIFISGPKDSSKLIHKLRNIKQGICALFKDGNRYVFVNGKKVPVLGRVGMRTFLVDLSCVDANVSDPVLIDFSITISNPKIPRELV